jgi:monomeric sarcosine oxidase
MQTFDTLIIGAGIAGSSAAYTLSQNERVLVLEQFPFLHDQGSSHGGSRIFRHAYGDTRYVDLAVRAQQLWHELEADTGERLLYPTGGLDFGPADNPELVAIEQALTQVGRPFEKLTAHEVNERFPAFHLSTDAAAIYQPDAGILAATRCVNALLRASAARGAVLRGSEAVRAIDYLQDRVRVSTDQQSYEAGQLIVTGGAWLAETLSELELLLHIEQQQVLYVRVQNGQRHTPERMPLFINRDTQAEVYGFPLFDHPTAIKISDHAGAPTITLDERKQELMQARATETLKRARTFLPYLTDEIVDHSMCLYTKTPDEHFILDRHPAYANVVIAGGFSGHGFKFGAVLGEIIAGLLRGTTVHDLSLFKVTRFADKVGVSR